MAVVNSQAVNRYRRVTTDSQGPVSLSHCSKTERLAQTPVSCGLELSVIFCTNRDSLPSEQEAELRGQWDFRRITVWFLWWERSGGQLHFFSHKQARHLTLIQLMLGKVLSLYEKNKRYSITFYHYTWSIKYFLNPLWFSSRLKFDSLWN